jgi:hypothetical protein
VTHLGRPARPPATSAVGVQADVGDANSEGLCSGLLIFTGYEMPAISVTLLVIALKVLTFIMTAVMGQ